MSSVVLSPAMPSPAITCSDLATCYSTVVITPSSTPAIISVSASGLGNRMLEATTSSGKHSLGLDSYENKSLSYPSCYKRGHTL